MDDVPRPTVSPSIGERAREWLEWLGLARLVTSALAVVVVCAGAWWLIRSPVPPPESALPVAAASGSAPVDTLPVPTAGTADPTASSARIVVHVAGAVERPGVYEIETGSRVDDAIFEAGGPIAGADAGALNLAAVVSDGARIHVPLVGEEVPPTTEAPGAGPVGPIDVNRATAAELETLPGVGPATAAAIVTERDRNGPFASVSDLERVPGIGPAKLAAISELVVT